MIFVDSHVHIHACFDIAAVLDLAAQNFRDAALNAGVSDFQSVICMTETAKADSFWQMTELGRTKKTLASAQGHEWKFRSTEEKESVIAESGDKTLIVIAGSQIVAKERLEVLALGTSRRFPDGEPIDHVISEVIKTGAIAVVPWGFGKWLGARGRIVNGIIQDPDSLALLGDNGNRLRFTRPPSQFELARRSSLPILPGSDPLPFRGEERRIGTYGFALEGQLDAHRPAHDLLSRIRRKSGMLASYGDRERPMRFLRNQFAMQIAKRLT